MPNGFEGSREDFDRLEAPLRAVDPILEAFARRHALPLTKNGRGVPERSMRWGERPGVLIQVYPDGDAPPRYTLWATAYDHRSREVYWARRTFLKQVGGDVLTAELEASLHEALEQTRLWEQEYERDA